MKLVRTSSFWRDLKETLDYFDDVGAEGAALRFLDALDATIDIIEKDPDLGSPWESSRPRRSGLRYRLVKGFENHVVLYRRSGVHVDVLRVVHASQDIEGLLG